MPSLATPIPIFEYEETKCARNAPFRRRTSRGDTVADITYTRTYAHNDWVDNEDVVQAGGEKGFNQEFHGLEAELDKISTTFGATNTAIQNIQRLNFLSAQPPTLLAAHPASPQFD